MYIKRRVNIGSFYQHFKGNLYQVTDVTKNSEGVTVVLFNRVCDDGRIATIPKCEPIKEFLSVVDKRKYPHAKQVFRYEEETFGFNFEE